MTDDYVTVAAEVEFECFDLPTGARPIFPSNEVGEDCLYGPNVALERLQPSVLDALVARWLDHVFAAVNRPSPFVRRDRDREA